MKKTRTELHLPKNEEFIKKENIVLKALKTKRKPLGEKLYTEFIDNKYNLIK